MLIWAANCSLPDYNSTALNHKSQALIPIDQRFSDNGATNYSVMIPIRGYAYLDNTFTLTESNAGGATDVATGTLFLASDNYIVSTGIAEGTAATYSDVILAAYPPSRNATTGAVIQTTTGTISAGSARTLDQVIAKAKYDYTRRLLNTNAGLVTRTGFGMAPFLSSSGAIGSANVDIGQWNASFTGKVIDGPVYNSISSTGIISIGGQATSLADNGIAVNATIVRLGTAGSSASWTTSYTPTASNVTGNLTISGLSALLPTNSVTTGSISTSANQSATNSAIAAAFQALLPLGSSVIANNTAPTNASFTLTLTADGSGTTFGATGTITFGAVLTAVGFPATMQVYSGLQATTGNIAALHLSSGFNSSASKPAGWVARAPSSSANNVGVVTFTGPAIWSGTPAPTFTDTAGAPGGRGITFGNYTNGVAGSFSLSFTMPSVAGGVTPSPSFTVGGAAIGAGFTNSGITPSGISTNGSTIFQNMSANTAITFLPTSGLIGSGSFINFGTSSAVTLTGDISFSSCTIAGSLALNVGATNYTLTLSNCGTISSFPFSRVGTGTINIVATGTTNITATLPAGFASNVQTSITLTFTDNPAVAPTVRVAELYKNSGTAVAISNPTYSNGVYTWTVASLVTDVYDGAIFFVDGYSITRGTSSVNTLVSGTATPETNIDFTQTVSAADTTFVGTTAFDTTSYALATNPYVKFTTSTAVNYTTSASTRTVVDKAKLILRRSMETSNAGTVAYRKLLARGLLAPNAFQFNQNGLVINQVNGAATSGVGLQINKSAANTAVVTVSLYCVDNQGVFYDLNTANARTTTTPSTLILFEGFSPGATASLTGAQLAAIGIAAGTGTNTALLPNLNIISDRINQASNIIPSDTTPLV